KHMFPEVGMKRFFAIVVAAVSLGGAAACHSLGGTSAGRPERPRSSSLNPYLIEGDELKVETAQNLYDVVRIQRPAWLTKTVRNAVGNDAIVVYLNDRKIGSLNILRDIPVTAARSLQYLSPTEAQLRYGPTHGSLAAIVVEVVKN
ncbi:MAG TPA: hypothetical protein VF483_06980, partial [Gemmatimonadaceae bacterium]